MRYLLLGSLLPPLSYIVGVAIIKFFPSLSYLAFIILFFSTVGSLYLVAKGVTDISKRKFEKRKNVYQSASYEELKILFVANPREAAMMIGIRPKRKS